MSRQILKSKVQEKYLHDLWDKMTAHLLAFYDAQQPEDIHQMRVAIKKIRAVSVLLQGEKRMKKIKKSRSKLRDIFQHAGRLRSVHVHLALMEQHQLNHEEHLKALKTELANETAAFYQLHDNYLKTLKKLKSEFSKGAEDLKVKDIEKIYVGQLKDLDSFFTNDSPDTDHLHEKRKLIKQLLYVHQCLPEKMKKSIGLHVDYLDEMQELIGNWHDNLLIIEILRESGNDEMAEELEKLGQQCSDLEGEIWTKANYFALKAVDELH
jgi:CHAD domain-containing protein